MNVEQLRKDSIDLYNRCCCAEDVVGGGDEKYIVGGMCEDLMRMKIPDDLTEDAFAEFMDFHDQVRKYLEKWDC